MGCCGGSRKAETAGSVDFAREQTPFETVVQNCVPKNVDAQFIFNVLVVYTRDCVNAEYSSCSSDELANNIAASIDEMNEAFVNSGISSVQGKLVSIQAIDPYMEDKELVFLPIDQYKEQILHRRFANLSELQAKYNAHIVMFVVNQNCSGDPVGGGLPATRKSEAFVIVRSDQLLKEYTPAHEIGHLFGAGHEKGPHSLHGMPREGETALGYATKPWRTIMAYLGHDKDGDYGAKVIPHFSNPDILYEGAPTGTAQANNAQQIQRYATTILALPD
jgi:hypothetical protein